MRLLHGRRTAVLMVMLLLVGGSTAMLWLHAGLRLAQVVRDRGHGVGVALRGVRAGEAR